jgi:cytidine deaminase
MVGFSLVNHRHVKELMNTRREFSINNRLKNVEKFRHMASLVTPNGHVIATGNNYMHNQIPISIHAEHDAINNAIKRIIRKGDRHKLNKTPMKVDLYVVRDNGRNSRPCNDCITHRIKDNPYFNIRKVIYTHEDGVNGTMTETRSELYQNRYEHITRHFRNLGVDSTIDDVLSTSCGYHHHSDLGELEESEEDIEGKPYFFQIPNG